MVSKSAGVLIIAIISWLTVVSITDGVLMQRYGLGETEYGEKLLLDLTGRAEIYEIDLAIFYDHILLVNHFSLSPLLVLVKCIHKL